MNSDRYPNITIPPRALGPACRGAVNTRGTVGEIGYASERRNASLLLVDDRVLDWQSGIAAEAKGCAPLPIGDGEAAANTVFAYEQLLRLDRTRRGCGTRTARPLAGIFTRREHRVLKGVIAPYRGVCGPAPAPDEGIDIDRDSVLLHTAPMFHPCRLRLKSSDPLRRATHDIVPPTSSPSRY